MMKGRFFASPLLVKKQGIKRFEEGAPLYRKEESDSNHQKWGWGFYAEMNLCKHTFN